MAGEQLKILANLGTALDSTFKENARRSAMLSDLRASIKTQMDLASDAIEKATDPAIRELHQGYWNFLYGLTRVYANGPDDEKVVATELEKVREKFDKWFEGETQS